MKSGVLAARFGVYFDEMQRCRKAGAYWALLHITVCLPDICAALQSVDGETKGQRYKAWCSSYANDAALTPDERWLMRNNILHQGRASALKGIGRYVGFAFGRPASTGHVDHKRLDRGILHLDVGQLAQEMSASVQVWIEHIENNPATSEASAVQNNLAALVQVQDTPVLLVGQMVNMMKTN